MNTAARQIDLFEHVGGAYAQVSSGRLTNDDLYRIATGRAGVNRTTLEPKVPIGNAGQPHNTVKRAIRWHQQSLRGLGLIQRVEGQRGVWELTQGGKEKLRKIRDGAAVIAFSTDLGVALWGNCKTVFQNWTEPVFLVLTSPPYPLRKPRAYGNPTADDYVDFICASLEPIVKNLVPGGNVVLNLGDVFEPGSPAKSTYIEEVVIALRKRLGLALMNRVVWASNKAPGPVQWASKRRVQLNEGYEHCLWFCNDPLLCIADNRRVLKPHSEKHLALIAKGGSSTEVVSGDGSQRVKVGSYGTPTPGAIPKNVWNFPNTCSSQRAYKRRATELGLAAHGAPMPLALARQFVKFLTDVGHLVVDLFGGSMTTALAAELEGRTWAANDVVFDYVRGAAERFQEFPGFKLELDA